MEVQNEYNIKLSEVSDLKNMDVIIVAVPHNEIVDLVRSDKLEKMYRTNTKILIDIKGIMDDREVKEIYEYWRL